MKTGIFQMTMPEYLQIKALSSGLIHTMLAQSPEHAAYEQQQPDGEMSAIAEHGVAVHDALLEGVNRIAVINPQDYAGPRGGVPKGWTNDAIKAARDVARSNGKLPMFPETAAEVLNAVQAARDFIARSELKGVFDSGKPEQVLIWNEGDVLCKARPDWLNDKVLVHVKTTAGSAQPESWIRNQLTPMGYDCAWGFYRRGLMELTGKDPQHVFLVIEQNAPYGCSLVSLAPAFAEMADSKVSRAIAQWQKCVASGRFPGYTTRIAYAEPKPWELAGEEEASLNTVFSPEQLEGGIPL